MLGQHGIFGDPRTGVFNVNGGWNCKESLILMMRFMITQLASWWWAFGESTGSTQRKGDLLFGAVTLWPRDFEEVELQNQHVNHPKQESNTWVADGYESIPINTIFSGMNIHKSQLFWCEQKGGFGFDTLPDGSKFEVPGSFLRVSPDIDPRSAEVMSYKSAEHFESSCRSTNLRTRFLVMLGWW